VSREEPRAYGQAAETLARRYLESLGMRVLARNVRGQGGEIDIVARDGETVVFVEVKARRSGSYGTALSAVDVRKRRRIRAVAADFLQIHAPTAKARFDVLAIDGTQVRHYRNAFA
jgi:putative endonuclease